jgi:alpha-L-arabinofuranosidase
MKQESIYVVVRLAATVREISYHTVDAIHVHRYCISFGESADGENPTRWTAVVYGSKVDHIYTSV